jgi:hypothetical protein
MNGMTSHLFAGMMTAVVLVFPTPSDLKSSIFGEEAKTATIVSGGIDRPAINANFGSTTNLLTDLDQCLASMSVPGTAIPPVCQAVLRSAETELAMIPAEDRNTYALTSKLRLGMALYCRQLWVESSRAGKDFDAQACQLNAAPIAEEA